MNDSVVPNSFDSENEPDEQQGAADADVYSLQLLGRRRQRADDDDDDQDQGRDRRHPSHRAPPPENAGLPPSSLGTGQLYSQLARLEHLLTALTHGPKQQESPANAARIIAGLATVPQGLIRRLEHVSALASRSRAESEVEKTDELDGDSVCVICQDRLLDGGDGVELSGPFVESSSAAETSAASAIIALPCAHVFHATCLGPWFARPGQTTCPMCRFDVDPNGVIWYGGRKQARAAAADGVGFGPRDFESAGGGLGGLGEDVDTEPIFRGDGDDEGGEMSDLGMLVGAMGQANANPRAVNLGLAILVGALGRIPLLPNSEQASEHPEWVPPPAPGPTLRDHVERREREAGLRCCDASCGVGPSDEDPVVQVPTQRFVGLLAPGEGEGGRAVCAHTFHPVCLVSAQRARGGCLVSLEGAWEAVEVACSSCNAEGRLPPAAWLEGLLGMAREGIA
ncbi:hypothetical protein B0H11DRAFT_2008434 [Mycena galericulata]|nr:hypothetical protein B0H11DRAFT_2008434 [Mycena galericulata]